MYLVQREPVLTIHMKPRATKLKKTVPFTKLTYSPESELPLFKDLGGGKEERCISLRTFATQVLRPCHNFCPRYIYFSIFNDICEEFFKTLCHPFPQYPSYSTTYVILTLQSKVLTFNSTMG